MAQLKSSRPVGTAVVLVMLAGLFLPPTPRAAETAGRWGAGLEFGIMKLVEGNWDYSNVDQFAGLGYALTVQNVEFGIHERRCHFVFYNTHPCAVSHDILAVLNGADATDIKPDRGIELQRISPGSGLRISEYHPDFHAYLVDKNNDCTGLADSAG